MGSSQRAAASTSHAPGTRVDGRRNDQVDVYADSKAGQDIVVRDPAATPSFPITPLSSRTASYAQLNVTGTLPATVEVVNRGDTPQTVKTVPVARPRHRDREVRRDAELDARPGR